jgi:hypothetical protein
MTDQFAKVVVSVMDLLEIADARGDGRGLLAVRAKLAALMEPPAPRPARGRQQAEVDREYAIWVRWCDLLSLRIHRALGAQLRASWMAMESSGLVDPLAQLDPDAVSEQRRLIASRKQSACKIASRSCDRYLKERRPSHLRAAAEVLLSAHGFERAHLFQGPKAADCIEARSRINEAVSAVLPYSARRWLLDQIHREFSPEHPPMRPDSGGKKRAPARCRLSPEPIRDDEPYEAFDLHVFFAKEVQAQYVGDMKMRRSAQTRAAVVSEADARQREHVAALRAVEAGDSPIQPEASGTVGKASEINAVTALTGVGPWTADLDAIFEDKPVDLYTFVTDPRFLGNPALSPVQFEAVSFLEQILLPETHEMLSDWDPRFTPRRQINFAYIQWGKGSGKDHVCRIAVARCVYLLMCLRSPQRYFGMPGQDSVYMLNVATSEAQARKVFFDPLKKMIDSAPWFRDRYQLRTNSIEFDKQIEVISGHSSVESQEGLNLIVGIADELSAFKTTDEAAPSGERESTKTADSMMNFLRSSGRTRFPRNFKAVAISYPRFKNDAIQQLCAKGRADNEKHGEESRIFVSGPLATWEVNPRIKSKDEFREDYDDDPAMARAMYECLPEKSQNLFFRDEVALLEAFDGHREQPLVVNYRFGQEREAGVPGHAPSDVSSWQVEFRFASVLVPVERCRYSLHADMAINGDSAGIAMAHVSGWREESGSGTGDDSGVGVSHPVVTLDFVISFDPDAGEKPVAREIQVRWFRKLIEELIGRGFDIGVVSMDNFQSADTLQTLDSRGIDATRRSTDRDLLPWETLRDLVYEGRLEAYYDEIAVRELKALGIRRKAGKIDHPPHGSKDRADAIAGAVMGALEVGGAVGGTEMVASPVSPIDLFMSNPWLVDYNVEDLPEFGRRGPMH